MTKRSDCVFKSLLKIFLAFSVALVAEHQVLFQPDKHTTSLLGASYSINTFQACKISDDDYIPKHTTMITNAVAIHMTVKQQF